MSAQACVITDAAPYRRITARTLGETGSGVGPATQPALLHSRAEGSGRLQSSRRHGRESICKLIRHPDEEPP